MRYPVVNDVASLGLRLLDPRAPGAGPTAPRPGVPEVQSGFRPVQAPRPSPAELLKQGRFRPFDPFRTRRRTYRWGQERPVEEPEPRTEGGFFPIQAPQSRAMPSFAPSTPGFQTTSFAAPTTTFAGPSSFMGQNFFGQRSVWG